MRECEVKSTADALDYILDCTLATVERLAMTKSRGKHEYERQISIAQKALDWCVQFEVKVSSRAEEITKAVPPMTVKDWAKKLEK